MTRFVDDDHALGERFASWRAQDGARAPGFERVVRGRERVPAWTWTRATVAFAAVAMIAVAVTRARTDASTRAPGAIAFTAGSLRVPTDFLLDQVASMNATAVPAIGTVDWYPLDNIDTTMTTAPRRRN